MSLSTAKEKYSNLKFNSEVEADYTKSNQTNKETCYFISITTLLIKIIFLLNR